MRLHHLKHHQAYVDGLNAAEASYVNAPSTRDKIALQPALKFNGGGKLPTRLLPCTALSCSSRGSKATSTTRSSGRISPRLSRVVASSVTASSKPRSSATLVPSMRSRNNLMRPPLAFRAAVGVGSGIIPRRRSLKLSQPQIRILYSVRDFLLSPFFCRLSFKPTILLSVSTFGSMYVTILSSSVTGYSRIGFVQAFYLQVR